MVCETFLSVFLSSCARFSVRRQKSFSIRPIVFAKGVSGLETFAFAAFSAALELARLCSSRPIYDGSSKLIGQKVETAKCGPGPLWSLINIFINFSTAFLVSSISSVWIFSSTSLEVVYSSWLNDFSQINYLRPKLKIFLVLKNFVKTRITRRLRSTSWWCSLMFLFHRSRSDKNSVCRCWLK